MDIPQFLEPFFEKPVGIFGYGVSGKAVAQVLETLRLPYVIYDQAENASLCSQFTTEMASKHSLIVYSPGFAINHPWLDLARNMRCLCLSELDFGSFFWKGKIIAITGTNGKSTLTCLLKEALSAMGKTVIACGNIGSPLSAQYDYFENIQAIAICEVSSFQAETVEYFVPDVVIWTTFDVDHLDRHSDLRSYFDAKWNLIRHLKTRDLFIGETVAKYAKYYGYSLPAETTVVSQSNTDDDVLLFSKVFGAVPQIENYLLALAFWNAQQFNLEVLKETAIAFRPLPHRLQKIEEIRGIGFWNDSKGTNFSATIAALKNFKKSIFWIGGGKLKGGDQDSFVDSISTYIEEAFLIGEAALSLEGKLSVHDIKVRCFSSLEAAIEAAFNSAVLGGGMKEILFSPGFSSLDMFKNAEERGNFFEKKVLELKIAQNTLELTQDH